MGAFRAFFRPGARSVVSIIFVGFRLDDIIYHRIGLVAVRPSFTPQKSKYRSSPAMRAWIRI